MPSKAAAVGDRRLFISWHVRLGRGCPVPSLKGSPLDVPAGSPVESLPLSWAANGSGNCRNPNGDYPEVVRALLAAGADPSAHPGCHGVRRCPRLSTPRAQEEPTEKSPATKSLRTPQFLSRVRCGFPNNAPEPSRKSWSLRHVFRPSPSIAFHPLNLLYLLFPESLCIKSNTVLTVVNRFRRKRGAI